MIYKKKITAALGFLRPVDKRTPLMRVTALVSSAQEETSDLGSYIRIIGDIKATTIDQNGVLIDYYSRSAIFNSSVSDVIIATMKSNNTEPQPKLHLTGQRWLPDNESGVPVFFRFDLCLIPPSSGKASQTGYEYETVWYDGHEKLGTVFSALEGSHANIPTLTAPAPVQPALDLSPSAETVPTSSSETTPEKKHKK